jgi:hypothetical protein
MTINRQLLLYLTIGFIIATVIGTLTHEFGHYIIAKCLGYEAHINYAHTQLNPNQKINTTDSFLITLGGPFETMLTGTIGLTLLFSFRKSFLTVQQLSFGQWTLIFISLFWLRQTANFFVWVGGYLFSGQFSNRPDEIHLAQYFELPNWTISSLTAIFGIIVLTVVVFKFIPTQQRLTFIASGLIGGVSGYILWLHLLGQIIMP